MHSIQLAQIENSTDRIKVLEEKVLLLEQKVKDLDENYDKLYKFMLEKSEVIRSL